MKGLHHQMRTTSKSTTRTLRSYQSCDAAHTCMYEIRIRYMVTSSQTRRCSRRGSSDSCQDSGRPKEVGLKARQLDQYKLDCRPEESHKVHVQVSRRATISYVYHSRESNSCTLCARQTEVISALSSAHSGCLSRTSDPTVYRDPNRSNIEHRAFVRVIVNQRSTTIRVIYTRVRISLVNKLRLHFVSAQVQRIDATSFENPGNIFVSREIIYDYILLYLRNIDQILLKNCIVRWLNYCQDHDL